MQICCLRADDEECKGVSDSLYEKMQSEGIETLYDDRNIRPGAMFSDADLIGVPVRVVVSPRNLGEGVCEITTRDKEINEKIPTDEVIEYVKKLVKERLESCK